MEEKYEVVKFIDEQVEIDVNVSPNENTVWLTQKQMSFLFGTSVDNISLHIKNVFKDKELDNSVVEEYSITATDGKRYKTKLYNLDMIISVGYRVKSTRGVLFRRWANKILKEYMLKGYVINENRVIVTNENYKSLVESVNNINNKIDNIDNRLTKVENKINSKELPFEKIFYDGEVYDAYAIIQTIFSSANNEIIIIDNYIDRSVLDRLKVKKQNVSVKIYTSINSRLLSRDISIYNNQYGSLSVLYKTNIHDRFIIIDNNNSLNCQLYHLGASIKDAGKKVFAINKMDSSFIKNLLSSL